MALPSGTVFEVRPTVGDDTNGGGFVAGGAGTDWSVQNSPQYSVTDGVGVGSTTVTSATAAFGTDVVDNICNIGGAWFRIVSRTNTTTIVVDRNTPTATGLTIKIGGAFATITQANSIAVVNNIVWVKATGTYTVTAALVITLDSHLAPGNPYSIIGYTSTRGDNGQVTWTTSTNSVDLIDMSSGSNQACNVLIQNFNFTTTASVKADCIKSLSASVNSVNVSIINCTITGFVIGIEGNAVVASAFIGLNVINTRVTACSSHGIRNGVCLTYLLGCTLDNNGGDGFNTGTGAAISGQNGNYFFQNCIFYKNSGNGVNIATSFASNTVQYLIVVDSCDFSTNTSAGLVMLSATSPLAQITNSIFDANGTYGIDTGSTSILMAALLYGNAFYNNTTAATRGVNAGISTQTLSASPYTSLGTDFSLNATSGGGAQCKGAGFPGTLNFGGTGHGDIGALQSAGGGGGGGGLLVNPGMTGGCSG